MELIGERVKQSSTGHGSIGNGVMWYTSLNTRPDNIRSRVIAFHACVDIHLGQMSEI